MLSGKGYVLPSKTPVLLRHLEITVTRQYVKQLKKNKKTKTTKI